MELKFQTLKNLAERLLHGRKGITDKAVEELDRYLVAELEKVLSVAADEADMTKRQRITDAHILRAQVILKRGR